MILARVRGQAPDLRLTIVGTSDRHAVRYLNRLQSLARSLGDWIAFRDNRSRSWLYEGWPDSASLRPRLPVGGFAGGECSADRESDAAR